MARLRVFWLVCAAMLLPDLARAEVDLIGSWHVLIHYKNVDTNNPEAERWDDRVWGFAKKGSRLQWTEFPIVVFTDKTGRFEARGGAGPSRVLEYWEPNDAQASDLRRGLQVNSRGSKVKSLKGSPKRGYKTFSAQRGFSASTVGYQQTWTIDDLATLPIFTMEDAVGTEAALASKEQDGVASGRTRYTTLEVSEGGEVLTGRFQRDENRSGSFRMTRTGAARDLESDGRTPNEKARDRFLNP
jgi:hypothetical protein